MTDVPTDHPAAPVDDRRARRGRWVLLLLVAAALLGAVAGPAWVVAEGAGAPADADVVVTGGRAAPQVPATALVLGAAAAAAALVGRGGRWLVVVVTVGAGVLVVAAAVGVLLDPGGAAAGAVADVTGVVGDVQATTTAAPLVAAAAGAGVVVLGGALGRSRGDWGGRSRRHESPVVHRGADDAGAGIDERSDWDALSRGDDPS